MSNQHQNVKALREIKRRLDAIAMRDREAVDWAIRVCEAADHLVNVKGRHHAELAYRRLEEAINGKDSSNG